MERFGPDEDGCGSVGEANTSHISGLIQLQSHNYIVTATMGAPNVH
jgi:hypothetical protein